MSISQTTVRFLKGVPFDNSYAHTRWFGSRTEQYTYFTNFPSIQRTQNNFQKSTGRMAIDVSEHVHVMMGYDYLMYQNDEYSNKWFYAFILNVEHISRNTTRVYFEVDPIQTYMFDVDFKKSQVVREHEHDNPDNIYPEGLQVGSEYETVHSWDVKPYPFYFMVIVSKSRIDMHVTTNEDADRGTFRNVFDPLNYYIYPIPRDVMNMSVQGGIVGEYVTPSIGEIKRIMKFLEEDELAVNNVVSIYLTDYLPLETIEGETNHFTIEDVRKVRFGYHEGATDVDGNPQGADAFRIYSDGNKSFTTTHDHLDISVGNLFSQLNESEPKLRYFPYTLLELTDSRGNVLNYKPEGLLGVNGNLTLRVMGGLTYANNVSYGLVGYNGATTNSNILENSIVNTDPQDLAILVNQTASYLQGAKNSMQAKQNTWASQQTYQERSASNRMATSAGNLLGGAVGLGMNALNVGYGINMLSTGIGNLVQGGLDHKQAGEDYQNKILEQSAMVEDLQNVPASLQKQGNNPNFTIGYKMHGVRLRLKRVKPQYLQRAKDYLHMFGTKTNRLKTPNLRTRTHFNYIQTTMLNIQSDYYNNDILRFKYIFEQGITLWHTNDVYNYDVSNNRR